MIINNKRKFVFIKTPKTAGSSMEFYLSQFCGRDDTITELKKEEEQIKKKFKLPTKRNYEFKKIKINIRQLKKFKFLKKIVLNDHSGLHILENQIKLNLENYFIFAFVRNPYHCIVSYFFWFLYERKVFSINYLKKLNKKELNILFKLFLRTQCQHWFSWIKNMIHSKKYKVHVYKFENVNVNIEKIREILSLKNEKFHFNEIQLKNLKIDNKIKSKIKFDKNDIRIILKEARYFFDEFGYSRKVPGIYS